MTDDQEKEFMAIVESGKVRVDILDALRSLIERVSDESFDRGSMAGASPYDGSWPAATP